MSLHEIISVNGIEDEAYDKTLALLLLGYFKPFMSDSNRLPAGIEAALVSQLKTATIRVTNPTYEKIGGAIKNGFINCDEKRSCGTI